MLTKHFLGSVLTVILTCSVSFGGFPLISFGKSKNHSTDLNELVLNSIKKMPRGGTYAVNRAAASGLKKSMIYDGKKLVVNAKHATPSYCSGATYLVFLYTIKEAEKKKLVTLSPATAKALRARGQADGVGVWGRWNSNGPGTAQLFQELKLGENFESFDKAQRGDFMKIFWTNHIGNKERGHSVIYLGTKQKKGVEWVTFWSSNQPKGYGEKSVLKSKIKWAIFSRLNHIKNLKNVPKLKSKNDFLASMLKRSATQSEVRKKVRMTGPKIRWTPRPPKPAKAPKPNTKTAAILVRPKRIIPLQSPAATTTPKATKQK